MARIGVLMTCPMSTYLEQQLSETYNLYRFWTYQDQTQFLSQNGSNIRAVVSTAYVAADSGLVAGADAALIEALPNLEIVSTYSVGLDKIDLNKCKEKGIKVTNTPDVLTNDVADVAIGLILALLRRIPQCDRFVKNGSWVNQEFCLTTRVTGKRVGIIGLGRIGAAIARRAEAFDCPIAYFSRKQKPNSNYKYYPNVLELASNSDVLVIACALTEETRHIVDREVISALGPTGVLINIGRGPHVDQAELVSALVEGRLGGAGLDVFENEPHVPEELFKLDNVVLLAHTGTGTLECRTDMANLVLGNLEAHFSGKPLLTQVV